MAKINVHELQFDQVFTARVNGEEIEVELYYDDLVDIIGGHIEEDGTVDIDYLYDDLEAAIVEDIERTIEVPYSELSGFISCLLEDSGLEARDD